MALRRMAFAKKVPTYNVAAALCGVVRTVVYRA